MRKANINVLINLHHRFASFVSLWSVLFTHNLWVARNSVICRVHVLQIVRVSHRELWEGNLRSQRRSLLLVVMEVDIACFASLWRILVAHGDVLCVVVPMFLKRRHSANAAVVVSLHIVGRKVLLSAAGTSIIIKPHDLSERRQPRQIVVPAKRVWANQLRFPPPLSTQLSKHKFMISKSRPYTCSSSWF